MYTVSRSVYNCTVRLVSVKSTLTHAVYLECLPKWIWVSGISIEVEVAVIDPVTLLCKDGANQHSVGSCDSKWFLFLFSDKLFEVFISLYFHTVPFMQFSCSVVGSAWRPHHWWYHHTVTLVVETSNTCKTLSVIILPLLCLHRLSFFVIVRWSPAKLKPTKPYVME